MNVFKELRFLIFFIAVFVILFSAGHVFVSFSVRVVYLLQNNLWRPYGMMMFCKDIGSGIMIGTVVGILWFVFLQFLKKR